MRVLVTGGAGFVGSHVAAELIKNGHKVTVLDNLSGGSQENIPKGAMVMLGDVTKAELVNKAFDIAEPEAVIHLAAYAAEGLSHHIRSFNYTNNVVGSTNIINNCINRNVKVLVFTSSIAVYGHQEPPFKESNTPTPCDPYGIAKYAVEMDLKAAKDYYGLNSIIFRPFNIFGSNQNIADPYRNCVGIFMNQCLKGEPMTVFGDGLQTRAFSHISLVAPVIAKSIEQPELYGKTFNVGGSQPYTVLELATNVAEVMGVEEKVIHLEARKEVIHASSDSSEIYKHLPVKPITLEDGLKEMADWVKTKGCMTGEKFGNIEVEKNLPPSWKKLL